MYRNHVIGKRIHLPSLKNRLIGDLSETLNNLLSDYKRVILKATEYNKEYETIVHKGKIDYKGLEEIFVRNGLAYFADNLDYYIKLLKT